MSYNMNDATALSPGQFLEELSQIVKDLKERIMIEQVAKELDLAKKYNIQKKGSSMQGECPTGHTSQGGKCFSIDTKENLYYCFSCGESGDIVELVRLANSEGFTGSVKWLVKTFAPELQTKMEALFEKMSPEEKERHEQDILFRAIVVEGKRLLMTPAAKLVMDYLVQVRSYDLAKLPLTDFLYWDTDANIRSFLLKKFPEKVAAIKALKLHGAFGDKFRLAIPFKDRNGIIVGFVKRAHEKDGFPDGSKMVRWDSNSGLKKSDLFGLHRIRRQKTVIVVEGYPDATYLPVLGLDNIVALGQAAFSKDYLEGLHARGVSQMILALDRDPAGMASTESIVKQSISSDIQVFVIDPPLLAPHKDPDEYVKAYGVDAFNKLAAEAESGAKWYTKRMLTRKPLVTDIERNEAIDEILEFAASISDPVAVEDALNMLVTTLQLTPELLEERFEQVRLKHAEAEFQKGLKDVFVRTEKLIRVGNGKQASKELASGTQKLLEKYNTLNVEEESLADFLQQKKKADSVRQPGSKLGYKLDRFPRLYEYLSGVQSGLYIIAADPNIGKTIFLINLIVDLIKSNPIASVLFYTMDDSRDAILNRLLAQLTGIAINAVQCAQGTPANEKLLSDAYELLTEWTKSGRLNIRESNAALTMESIQSDIRDHQNSEHAIVLIDGLYNVPMQMKGNSGGIREENIERANKVKELVKSFKIPVIATAEVRKREQKDTGKNGRTLHDIMETSKYGYNADVVFLLHPKDHIKYRQEESPIINVEFGKNKLSGFRDIITMEFTKAVASFKETGVAEAAQEVEQ